MPRFFTHENNKLNCKYCRLAEKVGRILMKEVADAGDDAALEVLQKRMHAVAEVIQARKQSG